MADRFYQLATIIPSRRESTRIFIFLFFLLNCNLKFSENITQDKLYMNFFYMDIFLNLFWNLYL